MRLASACGGHVGTDGRHRRPRGTALSARQRWQVVAVVAALASLLLMPPGPDRITTFLCYVAVAVCVEIGSPYGRRHRKGR